MALEGRSGAGGEKVLAEAVEAYEHALGIDAKDTLAAERLAGLYRGPLKNAKQAGRVLDRMSAAAPKRFEVALARFRHHDRFGDKAEAGAELAKAVEAAPEDSGIRLVAADYALRNGDVTEARRQLDAAPEADRKGLRAAWCAG